jgi:rieske iron-sulfur protein
MEIHEGSDRTPAGSCKGCAERITRRRAMIQAGLGLALIPAAFAAQADSASAPPQAGDLLVRLSDKSLKFLRPDDVVLGAPPLHAWPIVQASNVARNQNRLNELLLLRLDPATLNDETRSISVDGVLAYSALCTHAGCIINDWIPSQNVLACDCHASEFDPREAGKVADGPAAHPLPPLPLKVASGNLVVAKPFAVPIRFDE